MLATQVRQRPITVTLDIDGVLLRGGRAILLGDLLKKGARPFDGRHSRATALASAFTRMQALNPDAVPALASLKRAAEDNRRLMHFALLSDRAEALHSVTMARLRNCGLVSHIDDRDAFFNSGASAAQWKPSIVMSHVSMGYNVAHIDDDPRRALAVAKAGAESGAVTSYLFIKPASRRLMLWLEGITGAKPQNLFLVRSLAEAVEHIRELIGSGRL